MAESAQLEAVPQWDIADRMRKSLRHASVDVQAMADYLSVSRHSVGNWINGRIRPSKQTMRLWALRCGVSFSWLIDGVSDLANGTEQSGNLRIMTALRAAA